MKVEHDAWLSGIFGYDVFRVSLSYAGGTRPTVDRGRLLSHLDAPGPVFYYAKVPTRHVDMVQALCAVGFGVIDVNVSFARRPVRQVDQLGSDLIVVQDVLPAHYEAVLDVAASCFVYSRFHLDPAIPHELANAIKRAWVNSYIRKTRGERLLVGLLEGKPVGFLAVLATTANGERCRVIDLVGVDTAYQGHGVGRALVSCFMQQDIEHCSLLRVGTQVANIPSMRLYESLGFRMDETAYVLHAHMVAAR